jgi:hypothetical protein
VIALLGVVVLARIIGMPLLVIAIWKDGRLPNGQPLVSAGLQAAALHSQRKYWERCFC